MDNFIVNFRLLPNLPAGPLMTSLLTNIQNKASSASLELCKCMIDLNRLTVLETMQTVDILVKAIISDVLCSLFRMCILSSAWNCWSLRWTPSTWTRNYSSLYLSRASLVFPSCMRTRKRHDQSPTSKNSTIATTIRCRSHWSRRRSYTIAFVTSVGCWHCS